MFFFKIHLNFKQGEVALGQLFFQRFQIGFTNEWAFKFLRATERILATKKIRSTDHISDRFGKN